MKLVTTDIESLTLSTHFIEFEAPNGKVVIDIKKLLSGDGDEAYFNGTQIAKMFIRDGDSKKASQKIKDYLKTKSTKEYMQIVDEENNMGGLSHIIKIKFTRRGFTKDESWKNGTWFHKDLALHFFRTLDARFAYRCDQFLKQVIVQSQLLHIERTGTKTLFYKLGDTIRDKWIPNQKSDNAIKFAYSTLMTLANMKVLGMSAKKYCRENNLEVTKDMVSVRDVLPKDILERIKKTEEDINGFIKYGGVYNYEELKSRIGLK